jgi:hypothetical protein
MDEEAESSSRTSARLKGRSHPKIYISEDGNQFMWFNPF